LTKTDLSKNFSKNNLAKKGKLIKRAVGKRHKEDQMIYDAFFNLLHGACSACIWSQIVPREFQQQFLWPLSPLQSKHN
jgi:hypothetical protein